MIILHNRHDRASREWIATNAQVGDTILDWYDEAELRQWIAAGGTLQVSAFPSVVTHVPEIDIPEFPAASLETVSAQTIRAYQHVHRMPPDRATVQKHVDTVAQLKALCDQAKRAGGYENLKAEEKAAFLEAVKTFVPTDAPVGA
jgi:hypothetical protein